MKRAAAWFLVALLVAGCGGSPEREAPASGPTPTRAAAAFLTPTPGIAPIRFPDDEAPHDVLTEWWYYTGHLFTADGARYGFEFVVFQGRRSGFPTAYASHFAVTDTAKKTFAYDQRFSLEPQPVRERGFALALDGWTMEGVDGTDRLRADMPGYAIDLTLTATKPPVLHGGTGYLTFGPLGGSYYYSRTRMDVSGTLVIAGERRPVTGEAWMDHQWGNFLPVGPGGWDWFSVQLEDGRDLMAYIIRDDDGGRVSTFATLVAPDGTASELRPEEFDLVATGTWTSPRSGATYPMGWTIDVPGHGLSLVLTPTLEDQELDTRATTGVVYWEGEVVVSGSAVGYGYVELTGYAD